MITLEGNLIDDAIFKPSHPGFKRTSPVVGTRVSVACTGTTTDERAQRVLIDGCRSQRAGFWKDAGSR